MISHPACHYTFPSYLLTEKRFAKKDLPIDRFLSANILLGKKIHTKKKCMFIFNRRLFLEGGFQNMRMSFSFA